MKLDAKTLDVAVKAIQDEINVVSNTLRDKGAKRFEKPLVLGIILVVVSYYFIYRPPQQKLSTLEFEIQSAKAMSTNADAYKQARDRLRAIYAVLPRPQDKEHFLLEAVVETLRAEGLTSDSIQPPEENRDSNLIYQQIHVTSQMKFPELVGWLARVEASKPYMHVTSIELTKDQKRLGYCDVQAGIGTIVPEKDLTH